ncbi:MAG: urease accessory protein UreD [Synechococcus sp.]|nr:urease accessory protein UreD [Synechococcus sp.]
MQRVPIESGITAAARQPRGNEAAGGWRSRASLRLEAPQHPGETGRHQAAAQAPLKWLRAYPQADGRLEIPLLHTAGGLVGGDGLQLELRGESGSRGLLTSVAAQKVYGSLGRFRSGEGQPRWARQDLQVSLAKGADLEWLPQEVVLYADALFEQTTRVELAAGASFLGAEVVRLGRSAAGETLAGGCWRSALEIRRNTPAGGRWELVDRLELGGEALEGEHGLGGAPVFGSLVWAAPEPLEAGRLAALLSAGRAARRGLEGTMACGALEQGLIARYRGGSSQAARFWFTRLWALIRRERGLADPRLPRVWPFQEDPLAGLAA